ncbi:MAG: hypothetical protein HY872_04780 [Chloroflexi bacterium]|nr:hypothetical protein [Chloroflexota bacterium]
MPNSFEQSKDEIARLVKHFATNKAISETLAHLDLLESEGRVEALCRDGLVTWGQLGPTRPATRDRVGLA